MKLKRKDWRVVMEITRFVFWVPLRETLIQMGQGLKLILGGLFLYRRCGGPCWRIRRLWRHDTKSASPWGRCGQCGRLMHHDSSPGLYWTEPGIGAVQTCHRCEP